MTTITIDRAMLEQALASMVRAELVYGQPNQAIQEAIRAELAKPVEQADPLDWPLPCDIKIGGGTHSKGTSLRSLVLRMKALHEAAFPGQASITKEQQDANLERLRNPPTPTPTWHDAPTCAGWWLCLYQGQLSTAIFNDYEIENFDAEQMEDCRWYGPIQQEGDKP